MFFTGLHIIFGFLGLASGAVAIYAAKGANLHRKSGRVFVYTMLIMSASGAGIGYAKSDFLNVVAGGLTFYLVATALLTVRRPDSKSTRLSLIALLVGLTVGGFGVLVGLEGVQSPDGTVAGKPAIVAIVFGAVALIAVCLDFKMLCSGAKGKHRLIRHLWRMCFAFFIATASLFFGQTQVIPEQIRVPLVYVTPVLLVFTLAIYWFLRVLFFNYRGVSLDE